MTAQSGAGPAGAALNLQIFAYDSYHRKVREAALRRRAHDHLPGHDVVYDPLGRVLCSIQYMNQSTFLRCRLPTSCTPIRPPAPTALTE